MLQTEDPRSPYRVRGLSWTTYRYLDRTQGRLGPRERLLTRWTAALLPLLALGVGAALAAVPAPSRPRVPAPTARVLDVQGLPATLVAGRHYRARVTVELGRTWVREFGPASVRVLSNRFEEQDGEGVPTLAQSCAGEVAPGGPPLVLRCDLTPPSDGSFVVRTEVVPGQPYIEGGDPSTYWTHHGGYLVTQPGPVAQRDQVLPVGAGKPLPLRDHWAGCADWDSEDVPVWDQGFTGQELARLPWPDGPPVVLGCERDALLIGSWGTQDLPREFRADNEGPGVIGIAPRGAARITATMDDGTRLPVRRVDHPTTEPARRFFGVLVPHRWVPGPRVPKPVVVLRAYDDRGRLLATERVRRDSY
ncbi:hypothetical protein [Motilibacter rhizosphaerae]|uniref:hypothetical protein n=1 Tax=Motilibacter rhizosphaerae TaxID=598652 RepID=UPI00102C39DB|nr:hypothetical protein [Motilibacter rhizosphaerae]